MPLYTEFLSKIRRKNKDGGSSFFLFDSDEIDFSYKATLNYPPGSIATYNQHFYMRNSKMTGYNPGILPDDTEFWIPSDPGRDLRHWPTQADLEEAYPNPAEGSFATVGDKKALLLYVLGAWNPISGGGSKEQIISFDSDLDTVSPPILMQGVIDSVAVVLPVELASYSFEVKLNAPGATFAAQSDIANLEAWVNANVTTDTVSWILRISVSYDVSYSGETTLKFSYNPVQL